MYVNNYGFNDAWAPTASMVRGTVCHFFIPIQMEGGGGKDVSEPSALLMFNTCIVCGLSIDEFLSMEKIFSQVLQLLLVP
jgi:hypothetical protein